MVIALSTSHGTRALHRPRRGQVESGAQKIADVTSSLYLRTTATKKRNGTARELDGCLVRRWSKEMSKISRSGKEARL